MSTQNERPIIFPAPMVQTILNGRKTMTRRLLKTQPIDILPMKTPNQWVTLDVKEPEPHGKVIKCRFGIPGNTLWVRETWYSAPDKEELLGYIANGDIPHGQPYRIRPSRFMPRWASRIDLEITDVRVERLQGITEADAEKEGIKLKGYKMWRPPDQEIPYTRVDHFQALWDSINKKFPWSYNPWCWVISFKRIVVRKVVYHIQGI